MRSTLITFLLLLGLAGASLAQEAHPPFGRMDVFALEWASDVKISPDGRHVVYRRNGMDIMQDRRMGQLWLIDTETGEQHKLTSREVSESGPAWSPQGDRIAFVSSTDEGAEIYLYWLEGGQIARLTQLESSPSGLSWSPDGQHLAFSMKVAGQELKLASPPPKPKGAQWADPPRVTTRLKHEADGGGYLSPGFRHYFVLPAEGGTPRQVTSGDYPHGGTPQWTPDGKALIFSANRHEDHAYDRRNSELYRLDLASGKITALTDRKGPDFAPVISPDGKTIAYLGYDDRVQTYQLNHIYLMRLDGSEQTELTIDLDRNPAALRWEGNGNGLFFLYDDQGNTKIGYASLAGEVETITGNVGGTSIGRPYGGASYSVSPNGVLAYTLTTPQHPADVALIRRGSDQVGRMTSLNADLLDYRRLGKVEDVRYTSSSDGREIQGWVVYPPDFDESNTYPLLVENHGGPISNYGDRFSPEMQLYAAADYVVFYPNPRGSTSYGEEFGNLLYHNYPGDDYQDVMDGVDHLLQRSYLTEDSLFVTGGSAGGIMTAWIIGKNNRFRAAAVVKPVMNWFSKTLTADNYYGYAHYRYPGQPWENPETYLKFSPISLVANVETPTLVMVGLDDLRTPPSEAKQLYHALKLRKIETALVEIPGASHFIARRPSQLITKVDHILAWFERYR
mgnify:CR=1 FL=1